MPWDKISATELYTDLKTNKQTCLASNTLAGSKDNVFWKTRLGDSEVSLAAIEIAIFTATGYLYPYRR